MPFQELHHGIRVIGRRDRLIPSLLVGDVPARVLVVGSHFGGPLDGHGRIIEQVDINVHPTLPLVVDLDRHRLEVEMEERTAFRFGGRSWWMLCPICGCRCLKLYLPPGAAAHPTPFRCRNCWRLTYTAAQEAHYWDRGFLASPAMARVIRVEHAIGVLKGPATRKAKAHAWRTLFTVKI